MNKLKRSIYGLPIMKYYRLFRAWSISKRIASVNEGFTMSAFAPMYTTMWEHEIRDKISQILPEYKVFIDVGANVGFYTMLAAHNDKYVISVEPDIGNLLILKSNIKRHPNKKLISIYEGIASDTNGIAYLYGDGDMASIHHNWQGVKKYFRRKVAKTTLDNLVGLKWFGDNILIKIDVEGAEADVLRGANELLSREVRPCFIIETLPYYPTGMLNPSFNETFEILNKFKYRYVEISKYNYFFY